MFDYCVYYIVAVIIGAEPSDGSSRQLYSRDDTTDGLTDICGQRTADRDTASTR